MPAEQAEQDGRASVFLALGSLSGQIVRMKLKHLFLGGILGVCVAGMALADPITRPLSRIDATTARIAAEAAALAAFRAKGRPPHMIRYPVVIETREPTVKPMARQSFLPRTRWDFKSGSDMWTRAAMGALRAQGDKLATIVPRDIERWCPAYEKNPPLLRRAFWVGMMSALAKHESTYNPRAVGGGNLWYGLLQIYPDTARRYGCRARTGEALKNPADNLSCAARIMAVTVARDRAVAVRDTRWRGVAADWGPMTKPKKIAEMSNWTSRQTYCQPIENTRPNARPRNADWLPDAAHTSTKG